MNPNYVHTITLYHKLEDGTYKRTVFEGCFWKSGIAVTQSGTQASQSNIYTVRIPADKAPRGFAVSLDDIVIHGKVKDSISNEKGYRAAEILAKYKPEAFKVSAISDNTSHLIDRHYRLGG